ncbi:AraC family transcriptional regulator [Burkholderia gladioli]|uniref:AraC family transcriptional regulator n=1 Tax=Burkholderia gladioli TaxID=28095 RepID=UPI00164088DC|nr:AraC family transcriptional regulator [Burkholderia gladioli]MDN7802967.1 helix-turn-helix transcriptional regulator [Burkholderia gladioli]MDN7918224.1 helix-turn-helix transcriptional regulator [Burkholderia gladioli]
MNPFFYRFRTDAYSAEQRFEVWRDEVNAIFDVEIERSLAHRFNYDLSTGYVGSLLMGCGKWIGQHEPVHYGVKRSPAMIRRDGLDHFYLCLGITHSLSGYAARTPIHAEASNLYVLDLAYELDSEIVAGDTLILTIARDLLPAPIRSANLHGAVLQGPLSALLGDHLFALQRQLPHLAPADMPNVERATLALVSAALTPTARTLGEAEVEIDQAVMLRVRAYIDAHLKSADLTPSRICRDIGISRAHLYRLFSHETGVAAYIQHRRLVKIRKLLEEAGSSRQRLSTLAFQYGFKSESHFSRSFRNAFGCSPSEARERAASREARLPASSLAKHSAASLRDMLDRLDS